MKKIKKIFIKTVAILLLSVSLATTLASCAKKVEIDPESATKLSFKSAASYEYLKSLDGKPVTINGYMATSSPVDGSFMFLMNLPYQSCPFCVPNTSKLSNTMEVYPQKGEKFAYTTQAIKILGILQVASSEDKPFTDKFGYEFNFKIVDATYTVMKSEELSADMALWQNIASSEVVPDIYRMYDYLDFLCRWNTYFVEPFVSSSGEQVDGYYLWPSDVENYLYKDGAQYNYGYKDGYFDSIIKKIEAIDKKAFSDLVENVRDAQALAERAIRELEDGNYTVEHKYLEKFGKEDDVYTLTNGEELVAECERIYTVFSDWLGSWEM